jgi:Iap family predicted aminopeptidase
MATQNPYLELDRQILADAYSSDESGNVLLGLCDTIGTRFAGTEGERRGAEFIAKKFEEYGMDSVDIEEFEFDAWNRGEDARLQTIGESERTIPCFSLPYGGRTPSSGVEAELVDIGPGSADDIARLADRIRGRIVLTDASGTHRSEIYGRITKAGAVGFVMSARVPGMILPTGTVSFGSAGTVPAVGIAYESGLLLQRLLVRGAVRMRLHTFDSVEPGICRNVVGELRGATNPDEYVVVGGHMDSHEVAPGAVDNASGVTCAIEATRLLALQKGKLDRSLRCIGFGGEEVGLLGSYAYARMHRDEMASIRLMLNLDCVIMSRPKGFVFHKVPGADEYVSSLRIQMREELPFFDRVHAHSDHFPFLLEGVITAEIGGGMFNPGVRAFAHMAGDAPDKVSFADLREESALAARLLLRASNDADWPFRPRTAEEVDALLEKTGIREQLEFENQKEDA